MKRWILKEDRYRWEGAGSWSRDDWAGGYGRCNQQAGLESFGWKSCWAVADGLLGAGVVGYPGDGEILQSKKTGREGHSYEEEQQMEGCFAEGKHHTVVEFAAAAGAVGVPEAAAGDELERHCLKDAAAVDVAVAGIAVDEDMDAVAAAVVADG